MAKKKSDTNTSKNGATLGFEATLYQAADKLRKSATLAEIQAHTNVLTPGRYVGAEVQEEDSEPFEDTIAHLTQKLTEQMAKARRLDKTIAKNLEILGFGENS